MNFSYVEENNYAQSYIFDGSESKFQIFENLLKV